MAWGRLTCPLNNGKVPLVRGTERDALPRLRCPPVVCVLDPRLFSPRLEARPSVDADPKSGGGRLVRRVQADISEVMPVNVEDLMRTSRVADMVASVHIALQTGVGIFAGRDGSRIVPPVSIRRAVKIFLQAALINVTPEISAGSQPRNPNAAFMIFRRRDVGIIQL